MTKLDDAKTLIDQSVAETAAELAKRDLEKAAMSATILDLRKQLAAAPTPTTPNTPTIDPRFVLTVDEQFAYADGLASSRLPSSRFWPPYDGVDGTAGVGRRKGSLATIRGGNLVIAAERPSATALDWDQFFSTGVAMGPLAQMYGRWEIRGKSSKGAGIWTNLQLWPTAGKQAAKYAGKDGWSETVEVDIQETPKADRSEAVTTIHYGTTNLTRGPGHATVADFTQFHVWVLEWYPDLLVVQCDGKDVWRVTDKALIPTTPHHFVAQTDMGSWAGRPTASDPTRVELELDYVKVWKFQP